MNTETHESHGAVAGQVDCRVGPALAEALDAWWAAAYAEGREGRTHDTEGGAAQKALQDIWAAHSAQLAAAVAAERERCADALRCALQALDYCIEDGAELLNERTAQWGQYRKDRQLAMAVMLERHRAVAERLRAMLRA